MFAYTNSTANFTNSILWGNSSSIDPEGGTSYTKQDTSSITFINSDVAIADPTTPVGGRPSVDPLFDGTYHLLYGTPAEGIGYYPTANPKPPVNPTVNPPYYPSYNPPVVRPTPTPTPAPIDIGPPYPGYWSPPDSSSSYSGYVIPRTGSTPAPTVGAGSGTVAPAPVLSTPREKLTVGGKTLYAVKTIRQATIYEGASTKYDKVMSVHKDAPLVAFGGRYRNTTTDEAWRKVLLEGKFGFIREKDLIPWSQENDSRLLANIYKDASFGTMNKSMKIFDMLGEGKKQIGVATRDTVVVIYKSENSYSFIQCGKVKGWVQAKTVDAISVSDLVY